jgi:acyl-CoA thioester hydrolase
MTSNGQPFAWRLRVYYEDTDLGGVVYYANYLKFMERARTEFFRALGFEMSTMAREHNCQFVVQRAEIEYRRPARLDDSLVATARVVRHGHARLILSQDIEKEDARGEPIVTGLITLACLTSDSWRPAPMPHPLKQILETMA